MDKDKENYWLKQPWRDQYAEAKEKLERESAMFKRLPPGERFNRDSIFNAFVQTFIQCYEMGYTDNEILSAQELAKEIIARRKLEGRNG
jgi:hypothetical protein